MAQKISYSPSAIQTCVDFLEKGGLVSFPTETVYGLGANALNIQSVEKIFLAKGRPKSDPLILHVAHFQQFISLIEVTDFTFNLLTLLSENFCPGPLTFVLKASTLIPKIITAQGDFVGIRIPNHNIALDLLSQAKFPVAAPSANRFGHVSPTSVQHVLDDLGFFEELMILDSQEDCCSIGIESTVIKINEKKIEILRPGAIGSIQIQNFLESKSISVPIHFLPNLVKNKNFESPGMLISHYAPSLECYILSSTHFPKAIPFCRFFLKDVFLIDYQGKNKHLKGLVAYYLDASPLGNIGELAKNIFKLMRYAENTKGIKYILLPFFEEAKEDINIAVQDRIFRAASGRFIYLE